MTSQRLGRGRFSSTAGGFGFRRRVRTISAFTVAALLAGLLQVLAAAPAMAAQSPDLAPFGTVTASASQNDQDGTFPAGNAIDGDPATRWASGNGPDDATSVFTAWLQVDLGTSAQVAGLVTFQLSYPVVIVRARLLTIGKQYEQAAIDLGASPMGAVRRVLLPMLMPAILVSAVLVFADVIDDFVIVRYLSGDASSEPTSVKIYNTARAAPTPALNALATLMLLAATVAVVIGFIIYRWLSRGEKDSSSIESFAGGL